MGFKVPSALKDYVCPKSLPVGPNHRHYYNYYYYYYHYL